MFGRFLNTPTNVFCSFFANDFLIRQCCWNVFFCIERTNWSFLKREISPHLCDFSMSVPNLVGRVLLWVSWVLKSSCHREYFKKIFSWVFPGSKFFFSRVFHGCKYFSCGCFVGLKFFLVGILWVQFFLVGISWFKDCLLLATWGGVAESSDP